MSDLASASVPVVAPFVDEAPAAPRRRRGRGLLVLAVVLLALVVGAGLAHREGWFEGTRGEGPETDRADSAEVPDEIEPTDVEPEPPPLRGTTEAARPAEPPPPTFDRGALIEAIRKVATEVHRARGSRKDIEDGRQDIRIFRATGGLDDAIEKAEDAIDRARRLIEQYHARAVEEAVLVLAASARFPEESGRVLEEEMKSARDAWKEHRIDTITALRRIVAERPDSADAYEGAARRGLAHLFAK